MKIKHLLVSLACLHLTCSTGFAQVSTSQTVTRSAQRAVISVTGSGPYYQLDIPATIYPGSLQPDLSDVRVRNATGDLLPFAWTDTDSESVQLESKTVNLLPLKDNQSSSISSFTQKHDGSLVLISTVKIDRQNPVPAWILDVSQVKGGLLQARFKLADKAEGMFGFSLESSADLKNWQTVSNNEQLVQLRHNGALVQTLDVALHHVEAHYLRLRWNNPEYAPWIESVTIDSQQQIYIPPALQWSKAISVKSCSTNYCDYDVPGNTPINSLRILNSESNTLARVSVLGQLAAVSPGSSYHHRHSPLYPLHVLRHQRRAVEAQSGREVWLNETLVYRISQPNGEAKSPDLLMDGATYQGLRLQTDGPVSMLGKVPPSIQIASLPRRLVFLARGDGPYSLEWGAPVKDGAAASLRTLMPHMDLATLAKTDAAKVEIAEYVATKPQKNIEPIPAKEHKPWLWAALAAGLALLGAMVWSLLKNMSAEAGNEKK
ncbi:DUF3999 family protein [Undibacterium sp. TS12]|uniref:DUF3999 family protein n=1 Tax=Undibacterium sp. TS12 TaxID=2908202 RepID=UPI001F4C81E6|nr:DUF3999 family protein [Undibacterium sp. TS12]MCH8621735.1 DUF3999 domain-containing protein [Undibacterium sp. TS12]